jgi:hypothetical protein
MARPTPRDYATRQRKRRLSTILSLLLMAFLPLPSIYAAESPPKTASPDAAAISKATSAVLEVYANEFTKAKSADKQSAMAKKLLDVSAETKDTATRYVILCRARDLALQGNDGATALAALKALDDSFLLSDKTDLEPSLSKLAKLVHPGQDVGVLADMIDAVVTRQLTADDYDGAGRLCAILTQVGKRSNDSFVTKRSTARASQAKELSIEFRDLKPVFETLKSDPNNATANLKAGRFLCFSKGDWQQGLPLLAKADDPAIKAAAAKDVVEPATADERVAVGDLWWTVADKETGPVKAASRSRAGFWYESALKETGLDGLARAKVEKRLAAVRADGDTNPKTALEAATRRAVRELVGKWKVAYVNGNWSEYQISSDGSVVVLGSSYRDSGAKLSATFVDGWFWMDIAYNKSLERFRLENGKLTLQHWIQATPLSTPPKAPDTVLAATGTRITG